MSMVGKTVITMIGDIPTDPDREIIPVVVTEVRTVTGETGMKDMLDLVNREMGDVTSSNNNSSQTLGAVGREVKVTSQPTRGVKMRK